MEAFAGIGNGADQDGALAYLDSSYGLNRVKWINPGADTRAAGCRYYEIPDSGDFLS